MPKRRKRAKRRAAPAATTTTRRRPRRRRNPSNPPSRRRSRARAIGGRLLGGLNFKEALRMVIPLGLGMFAAKFGARKFGGGTETDPESWTWSTYFKASAGAALAGILANMLRPGMGQKVFVGGLALVAYKIAQNELIQKNETAKGWLGGLGADETGSGLLLDLNGEPYMLGPGGAELPLDESHRMLLGADDLPEGEMYGEDDGPNWGDTLSPVGPLGLYGDTLSPVGPLGSAADVMAAYRREMV